MRRQDLVSLTLKTASGDTTASPDTWKGRWVSKKGHVSATLEFQPAGLGWYWRAECDQTRQTIASSGKQKPENLQQAMEQAEDACRQWALED